MTDGDYTVLPTDSIFSDEDIRIIDMDMSKNQTVELTFPVYRYDLDQSRMVKVGTATLRARRGWARWEFEDEDPRHYGRCGTVRRYPILRIRTDIWFSRRWKQLNRPDCTCRTYQRWRPDESLCIPHALEILDRLYHVVPTDLRAAEHVAPYKALLIFPHNENDHWLDYNEYVSILECRGIAPEEARHYYYQILTAERLWFVMPSFYSFSSPNARLYDIRRGANYNHWSARYVSLFLRGGLPMDMIQYIASFTRPHKHVREARRYTAQFKITLLSILHKQLFCPNPSSITIFRGPQCPRGLVPYPGWEPCGWHPPSIPMG